MSDGPGFSHSYRWPGSRDPNDETFGDLVTRGSPGDVDEGDVALVGEPYDGAVIGRKGARKGPRALREALAGTKTHHFDAGPVGAPVDLGDVAIRGREDGEYDRSVARVQESLRAAAGAVHRSGAFPVFLGGDNSVTYANVAPLLAGEGSAMQDGSTVGVVNFDAHLDCRELQDGPSSGTPYRQLLEAGLDALAVVGARHFETSTAYHDYLREEGGEVVTAEEAADPVAAADRAVEAMGDVDRIYCSVDLDVLDAPAAPGVSAPTPGGMATRELYRALRVLAADDRLAGFEVVECAPRLDQGDRTARAGARAVAHVLAARQVAGDRAGATDGPGGGRDGGERS